MAPFAIVKSDEHWFDGGRDSLLYIDEAFAFGSGELVPFNTFNTIAASAESWSWSMHTHLAAAYYPNPDLTP